MLGICSHEQGGARGGGSYPVSFYYGYADRTTGAPTSCNILYASTCKVQSSQELSITAEHSTLTYLAASGGNLTLCQTLPRKFACYNYSLVTTWLFGRPVNLFVNDYIHAETG
ncbi:uncharacterized protein K489DRAFT_95220 [Dissoconium aciculare CBS 342.82]|uniref:Uncharacterized protein n=1 Tax=Dissoconium aciculare CBS 342.82 TaxID=1314786 RepID=A0A6J3LV24_9PEZI|nr:uncharacterized protein K489DRAFT_95220 [Dissoconium aciculare CBS 342.82]KAF1818482.1 hypothetical protein K489DRAFT_95220 [Dissoconium aciculare CBS 342.82]